LVWTALAIVKALEI